MVDVERVNTTIPLLTQYFDEGFLIDRFIGLNCMLAFILRDVADIVYLEFNIM